MGNDFTESGENLGFGRSTLFKWDELYQTANKGIFHLQFELTCFQDMTSEMYKIQSWFLIFFDEIL